MMVTGVRPATAAAGACLLSILLASCSDEVGGAPESSPSKKPPVPTVSEPLNADRYLSRPCDLIGRDSVKELGGQGAGEADVDSELAKNLAGPNCTWDTADGWFDVTVGMVHRDKAADSLKGIAGIYAERDRIAEFKPIEIPGSAGYPAVIARETVNVEGGSCPIYVGISNDLTFIAGMTNRKNPDAACDESVKVAAAVLDTLKKGA